jgi:anti-sigma regulatory factor (Ser/Thr protein kinase)
MSNSIDKNINNDRLISANFKPRARLLAQLGEQLIKNENIALIELVKNAYDADASQVEVEMLLADTLTDSKITITDDGSGMTADIVANVWLEPGSDFKTQLMKEKKVSKKYKRLPIGEKGIGRFGVHKLGNVIEMTTKSENSREVYVKIDWTKLNEYTYLKDVPVEIIEREFPQEFMDEATGTKIVIKGLKKAWTRGSVRDVNRALSSLTSPFYTHDSFKTILKIPNQTDWVKDIVSWESIKEFALFKFDVEMSGDSISSFKYQFTPWQTMSKLKPRIVGIENPFVDDNLVLRWQTEEKLKHLLGDFIDLSKHKIGNIHFEGYIFDMDSFILNMGVADKKGFKGYLSSNGGIRVFRDGLRVYDYGEPENDWLRLDHRRFQSPSKRISNNLVIGAVYLNRSDSADLEEKTNREGFVENKAYEAFKDSLLHVIATVETLRFQDKKVLKESYGPTAKSEPVMHILAEAKDYVEKNVKDNKVKDRIVDYLGKVEADYKIITDNLLKAAGAGLTMSVVVHEVEKIIDEVLKVLKIEEASDRALDLVKHLSSLIDGYAGIIRKSNIAQWNLDKVIDQALFNTEYRIKSHQIEVIKGYKNRSPISLKISKTFLGSSLINLIDNSIYWLERKSQKETLQDKSVTKKIFIDVVQEDDLVHLIFADNGTGFLVPTDNLAQPFMSTKPDGIGLGLHIVDEVMKAQRGILSFPDHGDFELPLGFETGALIVLTFKK